MAGLNSKIYDIQRKITAFYNETRIMNIGVLNNIWKLSRFNTNSAGGSDNKYANFFRVINTIDSIKDGAQKDLAAKVFMDDLLPDGSTNLPSPDSFKQAIKALFRAKIQSNNIRKIPYSRIKGDKHEKQVICDRSFYDCNLKPNKIAHKLGSNSAPDEIVTIGNKIDTGPSNTENMEINCKTSNDYLNKYHMNFLGYTNTELSFNNQNGKEICTNLILFGKTYSKPQEKALKQLAVGNIKKAVILNSNKKLKLIDKAGYLYYKSLGDKLIAYCYYLDCEPPPQQQGSKCLFTCDVFVALLAYIFNESFVYNENDSMPKVTNVFYRNIADNGEINYKDLCEREKTKILDEYNAEIGRIQNIMNDAPSEFMFTGDTRTYINTTLLVRDFLAIMIEKLQLLQRNLNDDVDEPTREHYTNIKRYKLMKLLKPNTRNEFIRTRYQVCINDATGFTNDNTGKKYTIYDLYQILLKQQRQRQPRQNGGVKLTDIGDNQVYDASYKVEPKIGFNDMTLENNLLKYVIDTYKTEKKTYTETIPSCFGCVDRIDDFFNNKLILVNDDAKFDENEKGQPYVLELTMTGYKRGYFDYGHIYDVMTYYFYADANYEDNYIINIIQGIFNGIINDASLPKTYPLPGSEIPDATEIQDVSKIEVTKIPSEDLFDVDTSQCAPNNYECINVIRNKWLKLRGNQKVPKEAKSEGATSEVTSSDDDEVDLIYTQSRKTPENENTSNSRESTSSGTPSNLSETNANSGSRPLSRSSHLRGENIDTEGTFEIISQSPTNLSTLRQRAISSSPAKFYGGARKTKKRKIKRRKTMKKNKKQKRKRKTIKK